jgi:hypothetical protein
MDDGHVQYTQSGLLVFSHVMCYTAFLVRDNRQWLQI